MRHPLRLLTGSLALGLLGAFPLAAQDGGVMADLARDVSQVEQKLVGLAKAMPENTYAWRPGENVRSVSEVFQHVAADNYLLPAFVGAEPPASTGIKATDYKTVQAYETRRATRSEVIAELEASFAHLKKVMAETKDGQLSEKVSLFGRSMSRQAMWIMTTTHLHEHLGQAIAYARSNGVTPPWSQGGN